MQGIMGNIQKAKKEYFAQRLVIMLRSKKDMNNAG